MMTLDFTSTPLEGQQKRRAYHRHLYLLSACITPFHKHIEYNDKEATEILVFKVTQGNVDEGNKGATRDGGNARLGDKADYSEKDNGSWSSTHFTHRVS